MNEAERCFAKTFAQDMKRLGDLMARLGQGMESKFVNEYAAEQSPIDDLPSDYESASHGE